MSSLSSLVCFLYSLLIVGQYFVSCQDSSISLGQTEAASLCHPNKPPSQFHHHVLSTYCSTSSVISGDRRLNLYNRKRPVKVIDSFIFNGEFDMLDIRLMTMWPYVDYFVIVESNQSFTGNSKPLSFKEYQLQYRHFMKKIHYYQFSMPINLTSTWSREEAMRNSLLDTKLALKGIPLHDGDVVIVADVDEILKPELLKQLKYCGGFSERLCFQTRFSYYSYEYMIPTNWTRPQAVVYHRPTIDNTNNNSYIDTITTNHKVVSVQTPLPTANELRLNTFKQCIQDSGWHCSYCFHEISQFVNKLKSFSHSEYNREPYINPNWISQRIVDGLDLFNRRDVVLLKQQQQSTLSELDAPLYVLKHQDCYRYLINRQQWYRDLMLGVKE